MEVETSTCSQVNNGWGTKHVHTIKQVLSHEYHNKNWGIEFTKNGIRDVVTEWIIEVWVDVSHTSCPITRRSRTGFFVTLNGNLLCYKSKLQSDVPAQSTTEAKYRALSTALNEVIWITMVLNELGISVKKPIRIKEDDQSTIKMETNNMVSSRNKHIDLRHHVIRYYNDKDTILTNRQK